MYLLGDCRLMYWLTSRSTVDRYISRYVSPYSVNSRLICWQHYVATVYRWIVSRYFTDGPSTYHWHLATQRSIPWSKCWSTCRLMHWSSGGLVKADRRSRVGRVSTNMWPVLDYSSLSVDSRPIVGWYFADGSSTINPLSAKTVMHNKH